MIPSKRIRFGRLGRPRAVSAVQWELPVALSADNGLLSLREVATSHSRDKLRPFETLEPAQQRHLTIARLQGQPNYPTMVMLGMGHVNRERAIALVEEDTIAGQQIIACERQVITHMLHVVKRVNDRSSKRTTRVHQDANATAALWL